MHRARQDLASQRTQGLGGGHVSHVRPSPRRLAFDFASWQSVFPNVLFLVFCFHYLRIWFPVITCSCAKRHEIRCFRFPPPPLLGVSPFLEKLILEPVLSQALWRPSPRRAPTVSRAGSRGRVSLVAFDQGESTAHAGSAPRFVMLSPTQISGSASRVASSRMRSSRVVTPRAWYVANKASVMTSKKET